MWCFAFVVCLLLISPLARPLEAYIEVVTPALTGCLVIVVCPSRESIYKLRPYTGEHLCMSPLHGRASMHFALARESIYAFRPYTGEHLRISPLHGRASTHSALTRAGEHLRISPLHGGHLSILIIHRARIINLTPKAELLLFRSLMATYYSNRQWHTELLDEILPSEG